MRRDWDYVSMQDYSADMAELSAAAAAMVKELRREIDGLRFVIWHLVSAAGGEFILHDYEMTLDAKTLELVVYDRPEVMGHSYVAKIKK